MIQDLDKAKLPPIQPAVHTKAQFRHHVVRVRALSRRAASRRVTQSTNSASSSINISSIFIDTTHRSSTRTIKDGICAFRTTFDNQPHLEPSSFLEPRPSSSTSNLFNILDTSTQVNTRASLKIIGYQRSVSHQPQAYLLHSTSCTSEPHTSELHTFEPHTTRDNGIRVGQGSPAYETPESLNTSTPKAQFWQHGEGSRFIATRSVASRPQSTNSTSHLAHHTLNLILQEIMEQEMDKAQLPPSPRVMQPKLQHTTKGPSGEGSRLIATRSVASRPVLKYPPHVPSTHQTFHPFPLIWSITTTTTSITNGITSMEASMATIY